jgi:hypothetical protein
MADMKFACSHCRQEIECDELWSGHQIQCPTCQTELTVPPKPDAPPHATLASAKPGQPRLSIGASRNERSSAPPPPPPQMATLEQQLKQARLANKGNPMKWVGIGAVVIIVGVGGYFGYDYYAKHHAKGSEANQQASAAPAPDTNAAPAEPPPPKEPPMVPAVWTLDLDKAAPASGKLNGTIAGAKFNPDTVRLDKVGAVCLLRFLAGAPTAPDLGFRVYLRVGPTETVTNRTWTVTQDLKGGSTPQIVKVWKTRPGIQASERTFSSGYAMKLELGDLAADGTLSGKIFLAVPDTEQSVVAGAFKATASLADAATPAVAPNPIPVGGTPSPMTRPGMDRYNRKR